MHTIYLVSTLDTVHCKPNPILLWYGTKRQMNKKWMLNDYPFSMMKITCMWNDHLKKKQTNAALATSVHGGNWVVSAACNKLVSHSKQQLLNCPSFVTAMVGYMVPSPSSASFLYTGGKWTVTCQWFPHWGTEYAEIKVPSAENPEPIMSSL